MGNVSTGACCRSYRQKRHETNVQRTEKQKFKNIQFSHAKSTQATQSNLPSFHQQQVPIEPQTKKSLTIVSKNSQITNKMSEPNQRTNRNSINDNIKILVQIQQIPLSQIDISDSDSNATIKGKRQSKLAFKKQQSKPEESPDKIKISKEDFARELRNTDISGLYLPEVTVGPRSQLHESRIYG